jgi:hypothetical protein
MNIYTCDLGFDILKIRCDFAQASSNIDYQASNDDDWISTPFQCADACHEINKAFELVIEYLGTDYWKCPDQDIDEDDDVNNAELISELVASCTIEGEYPIHLYKLYGNTKSILVDKFRNLDDVYYYTTRNPLPNNEQYQIELESDEIINV